jgi:hypothetical protein
LKLPRYNGIIFVPKLKNSGSRGRISKLRVIILLFNIYNSSFQREAQTNINNNGGFA